MQPETSGANTRTWLKENSEVTIKAYTESCMMTLTMHRSPISNAVGIYDTLRKISTSVPALIAATQPNLEAEFQAWDLLSDEALRNFELELE